MFVKWNVSSEEQTILASEFMSPTRSDNCSDKAKLFVVND